MDEECKKRGGGQTDGQMVMTGRDTQKSRNKRGFDKYEMVTITAGRKGTERKNVG